MLEAPPPPRYWFRRLIAFHLDHIFFGLALLAVALPILFLTRPAIVLTDPTLPDRVAHLNLLLGIAVTIGFLALNVWFLHHGNGQTPAKRLLRIAVHNPDGGSLWIREILRLVPSWLVYAAIGYVISRVQGPVPPILPAADPQSLVAASPMLQLIGAVPALFDIWYYIIPLIFWTGQMRHDRWTGMHVVHESDLPD